jgi:hypothetical protein
MLTFVDVSEFKPRAKRAELTQEQKQEWFNKVKPTANWKYPIKKTLVLENEDQIAEVMDSIMWFVGGLTDYEIVKRMPKYISVKFYNQGYYNNIGA